MGWAPVPPVGYEFGVELWNPQATALDRSGAQFGFSISGPAYSTLVVEACANLAHAVWFPVSTNDIDGNGLSTFSDPQAAGSHSRFYRFRSP